MTVANLQVTTLGEMVNIIQEKQTAVDFSSRDFRNAMGKFATGVVVISSFHDGQPHAMTANAFMSGSLDPALVLVSVDNKATSHQKISLSESFGISILSEDQINVSNHFAGKINENFSPEFDYLNGFPVIKDASVQLVTKLQFVYPCGDHTLFVGLVVNLKQQEGNKPLVFHTGKYSKIES
ncbi:flavin reductase family protein [Acinetobacter sp. ASP199]|uniref:flavin reductase family protein n=1 Tax=unclassified Acinetobacter TaxID=196816 RepID=UPI001F615C29|nr:flavin reductase family protein [Acinetobacter sp. ASP199]UNT58371.1 flavin reductase family protein [Acinetobacter sp. ASP199]